ncbi:T9SS type A sorting domain-containing protein [candidate division KSB1 bacterium]|nr:T9SS type A sorting domain-containing protein [candidate division KSB1 bacterium]
MHRNITIRLIAVALCISFFYLKGYAQGDNSPDPLVNLALINDAIITGSVPNDQARGIPEDILWNPATNDWATSSTYHEYGLAYNSTAYKTKEDPLWWQVVWQTAKNINYITCTGSYPNQPQPTTGWAVQIMVNEEWQDLAKAHNGWNADTLRGTGAGIPTQTNWLWDGQLVWKGLKPVVTKGIRFTAYANTDSLSDGRENFADSLWSFAWTGRDLGAGTPKSVLIQYLDFSGAEADNELDPMINLALLHEAVVSADFQEWDFTNERGQPADILYDPVKDDYHNKNNSWGEFGYPYGYFVGYPQGPDSGFMYMVEWPVPKKINYISWGGCYAGTPQPDTPWALQYLDCEVWKTLINGIGGSFIEGDTNWPYTPGVDADAQSIWMTEDPITTKSIRLCAWSDGFTPLYSFIIRCRGGACINVDDSENPFKAVLVRYAEINDPTAIGSHDLVQPVEFALYQNYPNPFNPKTTIQFTLPKKCHVTLKVFDILGRCVSTIIDEQINTGHHEVQFNAAGMVSGIYFYQIQMGEYRKTKKMLLSK